MANYRGFLGSASSSHANPPAGVVLDYFAKTAGPVRSHREGQGRQRYSPVDRTRRSGRDQSHRVGHALRRPHTPRRGADWGGAGGAGGRGGRGGGGRGAAGAERAANAPAFAAPETGGGGPGEPGTENPETAGGGGGGGGGGGRGGFGGNRGYLVDPGEYTVALTVAGKTETKTVAVEDDPRLEISAADRAKRRTAITKLYTMTRQAEEGRRKIVAMNTAVTTLTESWKRPAAPAVPDSVKKAADDTLAKIKAVLGTFEAPAGGGRGAGGGAGAPPPYTPPPVNQKINRLMGVIDAYSGPPTSRQLADIEECAAQLQTGMEAVNKLDAEVPSLNKLMQDAGVPYFTVDITNVPPAVQGGRGGGN